MSPRPVRGAVLLLAVTWIVGLAAPARTHAVERSQPSGMARAALEHPEFDWRTLETRRCRVHYLPGTFAARHVAALARSADACIEASLAVIDEDDYERPLDVFYVDSRARLHELTGIRATGYADRPSSSVYLVCRDDWRSFDMHEIMHAVSLNLWGEPHAPVWWIREGLAVHADGRCRDESLDALAAEYLRRGELPAARDLIFRFAEQGEIRAYLCSGSLVRFLLREFGVEHVRTVWQEGAGALEETLGVSLDALDARWRRWLRTVKERPSADEWAIVTETGCG